LRRRSIASQDRLAGQAAALLRGGLLRRPLSGSCRPVGEFSPARAIARAPDWGQTSAETFVGYSIALDRIGSTIGVSSFRSGLSDAHVDVDDRSRHIQTSEVIVMTSRSVLWVAAVAALVALAGCMSQPTRDGTDDKSRGMNYAAKETRCPGATCVVEVKAEVGFWGCAISSIEVDPEVLVLTKPNTTIEWHLKGDFAFCPTRGDGVFITSDDPKFQFRDPESQGEEDSPGTGCRKKFRMRGVNDEATRDEKFKYMIRFRSASNKRTLCERDPFVRNGR
jgi:hypothetical protein